MAFPHLKVLKTLKRGWRYIYSFSLWDLGITGLRPCPPTQFGLGWPMKEKCKSRWLMLEKTHKRFSPTTRLSLSQTLTQIRSLPCTKIGSQTKKKNSIVYVLLIGHACKTCGPMLLCYSSCVFNCRTSACYTKSHSVVCVRYDAVDLFSVNKRRWRREGSAAILCNLCVRKPFVPDKSSRQPSC